MHCVKSKKRGDTTFAKRAKHPESKGLFTFLTVIFIAAKKSRTSVYLQIASAYLCVAVDAADTANS